MTRIRRAKLDEHGNVMTTPVPREVQRDLDEFMRENRDALNAVLAKHGLTTYDIAAPEYELVVPDESEDAVDASVGAYVVGVCTAGAVIGGAL